MPDTNLIDLDAIRAREAAATPGPWVAEDDGLVWGQGPGDPAAGSSDLANAAFIAAARQDIPDLIAEVERLVAQQVEMEEMRAELDAYHGGMGALAADKPGRRSPRIEAGGIVDGRIYLQQTHGGVPVWACAGCEHLLVAPTAPDACLGCGQQGDAVAALYPDVSFDIDDDVDAAYPEGATR